ncbi:MAG TPA: Gmad2 immunoglobulin-like domain-containing protein, partial [Anaerolineales bacterium]
IQVFATSARDGGITHLAAVGVSIAPSGPENIVAVEPHPERIVILEPAQGASISGGMVHVEGFGLASFEQHLLVEVYDEQGSLAGSQPVTVQSPEMGHPGPFSADVSYNVQTAGAGRVVVRDPSPAFNGDVHLSSVEVRLEP